MLSLAMLQNANISQRGAFPRVWCPGFCNCLPGDVPGLPGSGGRGWGEASVLGSPGTIGETVPGRLLPTRALHRQ